MTYQDVMETYRHPISVRYIPRLFGWLTVFMILVGVHSTAYAMDKEPVIWVQVPQWTDDWAVCAVCLLYTSPSPRDLSTSRMPSSA